MFMNITYTISSKQDTHMEFAKQEHRGRTGSLGGREVREK
jgi:hypothetical protein